MPKAQRETPPGYTIVRVAKYKTGGGKKIGIIDPIGNRHRSIVAAWMHYRQAPAVRSQAAVPKAVAKTSATVGEAAPRNRTDHQGAERFESPPSSIEGVKSVIEKLHSHLVCAHIAQNLGNPLAGFMFDVPLRGPGTDGMWLELVCAGPDRVPLDLSHSRMFGGEKDYGTCTDRGLQAALADVPDLVKQLTDFVEYPTNHLFLQGGDEYARLQVDKCVWYPGRHTEKDLHAWQQLYDRVLVPARLQRHFSVFVDTGYDDADYLLKVWTVEDIATCEAAEKHLNIGSQAMDALRKTILAHRAAARSITSSASRCA